MTYRSDLDALDARHSAIANDLAAKTRELEQATKLLEQAKLPILDNIRVASPCTADWSQMTGDERARHCNKCDKQVFDLSEMTRAEAEALIIEKHGKLCARYYRRADGTILTSDCRVGAAAGRKRKIIAVASLAMISAGVAAVVRRHNRVELDADRHSRDRAGARGDEHARRGERADRGASAEAAAAAEGRGGRAADDAHDGRDRDRPRRPDRRPAGRSADYREVAGTVKLITDPGPRASTAMLRQWQGSIVETCSAPAR